MLWLAVEALTPVRSIDHERAERHQPAVLGAGWDGGRGCPPAGKKLGLAPGPPRRSGCRTRAPALRDR